MRVPVAQVAFFRDIQHAFSKGVDPDVLLAILLKFALIAVPLVTIFVVWRYWDKLYFFSLRAYNMKKHEVVRKRIAQHLASRRVTLEVYVLKSRTQQFVGRATISKIGLKRMSLGFMTDVPNALSRVLLGKRIICYCRPFKVGGSSVNSFHSYIIKTKPGVAGIKSALLHTPAEYVNTVRRCAPRKRPAKPDAVKVRLWGIAKKDKFAVLAPDFETDHGGDTAMSWKAKSTVVNISSGGLKLEIHPKRGQVQPKVNEQVVLEVMVLNPAKKSFVTFFFTGAVRSVARPPTGAVYLGIQFMAQGERTGSRAVKWRSLQGEVCELKALLG